MKIKEKKVIDFFNKNKKNERLQDYKKDIEQYDFYEFAIWSIEYLLQEAYYFNLGENKKNIDKVEINKLILNLKRKDNTTIGELLDISTLNARNSDRLDFQEYSTGLIKDSIKIILDYNNK